MAAIAIAAIAEIFEITALVSEAVVPLVGETLAPTVGKGIIGTVASEIAVPIDNAATNLFNDNVKPLISDYFALGSAIQNDPTSYALQKAKEKNKKKELNKPIDKSINKKPQKIISSNFSSSDAQTDIQTFTYSVSDSTNTNGLLVPIIKIPAETQQLESGQTNQENGQENKKNTKVPYGLDIFDLKESSPRDLARLVINISKKLALTGDPVAATNAVIQENPTSLTLVQKVNQYVAKKSLPSSEEYKKIARVFNGRNINYESFSIRRNPATGLIEVTGVNEIGQALTLPENTGFVLPSVPGTVFMGPCSRNNNLPARDRIEDWFSFFHDYSWRNGNFNRQGDLQFISRLSQNLDRVKPENLPLINSTIIYFSNVSLNLGLLVDQPREDIFEAIGNTQQTEYQDPQYMVQRSEFYSAMNDELNNYTKTDGFLIEQVNKYSQNIINNTLIQLN